MRLIDTPNITDARRNLALEEYCLRRLDMKDASFLLFYVNAPSVIIGRNQNTVGEINSAYVRKKNIAVVRRVSGGGAVYHDQGNLNFSFMTRFDKKYLNNFKRFTDPMVQALRELGVPAELTGRNDIVAGGRKISGNAQFSTGKSMLSHGTLLLDTNLEHMVRALNVDAGKIISRGLKSVRARVANISEFLSRPMAMPEFEAFLRERIFAGSRELRPVVFTTKQTAEIDALAREKYQSWNWNYGRSPRFNIRRDRRFDLGRIDARIEVNAGRIEHIRIYGDFLGHGDIGKVEAALAGILYRTADVREALASLDRDVAVYFGGLDAAELADFLVVE